MTKDDIRRQIGNFWWTGAYRVFSILVCVLLLSASIPAAWGQSAEELGQAAEQRGQLREALRHYVAALQAASEGSSTDQRLREKIIRLVQRLDPPPAIPDEAERYMGRGQAALELAQTEEGYKRAISEFQKALRLAPWWAAAYFNLGVVQEKAGQYDAAIRNLKLYLHAAPNAPDAGQVRAKIGAIEYKQEAAARPAERLIGIWTAHIEARQESRSEPGPAFNWSAQNRETYRLEAEGTNFRLILLSDYIEEPQIFTYHRKNQVIFRGRVEGRAITGTYVAGGPEPHCGEDAPIRGEVSGDGSTITFTYQTVAAMPYERGGCYKYGRLYAKYTLTRKR
jgi:tetratricopeptide (TPR) repeat protein